MDVRESCHHDDGGGGGVREREREQKPNRMILRIWGGVASKQ